MPQHQKLCFVIADGGHARFVYPAGDNALHTIDAVDSTNVHKLTQDLVSDRSGPGITPRHDPHDMEKTRFAQRVGERVKHDSTADAFDALVLVAPAHVLHEMMEQLDPPAKAKILGTLAKDLTKVPDHELWPHLKEWVRPTHRV